MTRYRWVAARKAEGFPTTLCCDVAAVSRQAFYDWRCAHAAGLTDREAAETALVAEIKEIHAGSGGAYGSPRVTAELRARGRRVNPKRVARLMKAHHIAGIRLRRPKRTTTPAHHKPKLPDLLGRRFSVGAPDRAWCSDITYVRTDQGWLHLAVVLDVGSRRLLGYAMSDRIDTRLVQDALNMSPTLDQAPHTIERRYCARSTERPRPFPGSSSRKSRRSFYPACANWSFTRSETAAATSCYRMRRPRLQASTKQPGRCYRRLLLRLCRGKR